jgi:hypothetical protein
MRLDLERLFVRSKETVARPVIQVNDKGISTIRLLSLLDCAMTVEDLNVLAGEFATSLRPCQSPGGSGGRDKW